MLNLKIQFCFDSSLLTSWSFFIVDFTAQVKDKYGPYVYDLALYHHIRILFWLLIFKARLVPRRMITLFYTACVHNFDAWFFWILLISLPFNVSRYHPSYIAITLYNTLFSKPKRTRTAWTQGHKSGDRLFDIPN